MKKILLAAGLASLIGFSACDDVNIYNLEGHQGAFILNQGAGNGSISYYNYERETCQQDIYTDIGPGATTIAIHKPSNFPKGIAYVAVPSANSIERIDLERRTNAGSLDEFTNPKDILLAGESKLYVAHGDSSVSLYDLAANQVVKTYELTPGAQKAHLLR
ncbi:hypothetical protein [Carboxylicivirga taeanensis]|uniref:hypothetical protein n=1 Tax=Carboxylicivirga taeanensis TaxID=1416875 RepID=UPI003F6DEB33